ncbi:(Fe-S)-binding protein [Spirochaetota bacterium]
MAEEYCYPIERKTLSDYYEMVWRCAKCGYCRNVFPSDTEQEEFGRQCPPGDYFKFESYFASGRNEITRQVIDGNLGMTERLRHILYTCTTCGHCEEWCHATQGLYPLKTIMALREHFVQNDGEILPEHKKIEESIEKNHNRLNRNNRDRTAWLTEGKITKAEEADILYFVGCRSSFRRTEIAKNTYELLTDKLGLKVGLIEDERCCGRPLIDIGKEEEAFKLIKHNVDKISASGVKMVLFSCAECFHTFNSIEKFGMPKEFEAIHLSQFIDSQIKEGKLSLGSKKKNIAFHDPCYLGRHEGEYEAPRAILSSIKDATVVELPRNRKNAWCCGSGGGVHEAFGEYSQWIAMERMEEVNFVKADTVVTSCPGCKGNLWGPCKANDVEIMDLAELVNQTAEVK